LYLTGHPISQFEAGLNRFVSHRIGDLISDRPMETVRFGGGKAVTVAGLIDEVKKRGPRTILNLDDRTGRLEVTLFEDVFQRHRDLVAKDALVLVEGSLRFDEFSDSWRLSARKITELDKVREQQARRVVIKWPSRTDSAALLGRLADILTPFRGGPCPITVEYAGSGARGALTLGPDWTVRASRELLEKLESLTGRGGVQVVYGAPPGGASASFADGR
jgi:DNA polymerase III subunit alpha